ncbi:SWI/SNF complex subunit SWI3C-like [Cucurbita moschata]|uniref:SWI/SNF complex subunit SWI3C-like n=1 Tax=Cucurbita moschata TaxID=3662 RepID=A0A6J1FIF8_CUCMO|nr:SWI/SNF complex subunit SWI3C-like [Cucurbita moschata]
MPASPSFPSGSRGKWKKKKRDTQIGRRNNYGNSNNNGSNKHDDDDEDEDLATVENQEMERDNDDSEDPQPTPNLSLQETELLSDDKMRVSEFPQVVKRAVTRPHSSVLAVVAMERANQSKVLSGNPLILENVSYGQLQALSAMPADSPALLDQERVEAGNAAYVITPPSIMEGCGVVKRFGSRVHVVPMHSDWFSPATVHRLERQVVPHFFSGKLPDRTPEKYMEIRNFVVAKYMENPEKRVTVSDCQGLVNCVSNDDLTRIVRFLDHWGIINYCAPTPSCEPWNRSSYLREDMNGEIHVPSAALKPIDSLIKFDKPKCRLKAVDIYSARSCHDDNDDLCDLDNRIRERLAENHCSSCSRTVPIVCYQSQKEVDVLLCTDCFHEGKYVAGHSSIDFLRVDMTKEYGELDSENWTDQETLLLLEAIELYNENWNEITEHVGSKSKAQCIIHFLRLSVEDGILENVDVPGVPLSSNSSHGKDNEKSHSNMNGNVAGSSSQDNKEMHDRLPFANSGNPVMALVAFLASAIGPRVAASCAHASLAALSEDSAASSGSIFQVEGSVNPSRTNVEVTHGRDGGSYGKLPNSVKLKDENKAETEVTLLSAERVKVAAKVGLAAAATKAKLFADHEEREIQRLSANIINHQLKRLELKLKQFAEVETFLMKECEQVERTGQRFVAERARMLGVQFGAAGVSSPASLPGVIPPVVNNNRVSSPASRPNVISPPPSQPSVSGYGNNQPLHPHMSYVPRQSMFGLGQRVPLSAIQQQQQQLASTTSSNAMFNGPSNAQASLSHPMMRPVTGSSSGLG